ncbi:MAG: hypothetical protein FJZ57_02285 [Chlamydiae bacterium]|nr:hypothetical protein [Chlamydiota bacterium]
MTKPWFKRSIALFIPTSVIMLILSTGCASYNASALSNLQATYLIDAQANSSEVVAVAKAFTKQDCIRYLDRDLIRKGYQPLQLYVENRSNKTYSFALNRISLPYATSDEVADKVHTSTVGRITGYGVGALFIWPLVIPAIIDGIKSSEANQALDEDFYCKSVKDQIIGPYSHMNTIIFVPRSDFKNNFNFTLIDIASKEPVTLSVQAF